MLKALFSGVWKIKYISIKGKLILDLQVLPVPVLLLHIKLLLHLETSNKIKSDKKSIRKSKNKNLKGWSKCKPILETLIF